MDELAHAETEATEIGHSASASKIGLEEQARQLRTQIESLQAGAGNVVRQGQQLRERKAQLESLRAVSVERSRTLESLIKRRGQALDHLEAIREDRFKARSAAAKVINKALGPKIRIVVTQSGQFDALTSSIADLLRGSGLHYGDLAPALAARVSPRELLEAADSSDFSLVADAAGISKDRAARVLAQLKEADLGALATVPVEDQVEFQLLDGSDYKDISELSTGQRCTVILPLVLRHTQRLLIVSSPKIISITRLSPRRLYGPFSREIGMARSFFQHTTQIFLFSVTPTGSSSSDRTVGEVLR